MSDDAVTLKRGGADRRTDSAPEQGKHRADKAGSDRSRTAGPACKILLDLILSWNLPFHIDRTGEPCVYLPGDPRAYPIQSRRVRAYISVSAWNSIRVQPSASELNRATRVLEGLAWNSTPRDATHDQLLRSLEDKPVLQVVIEFMREREKHETQMQTFLTELEEVALKHRFDMYSKTWPKTAAHLSAQLRQEHNKGILEQFGVAVEITRNNSGAKVVLRRVTPRIPGDEEETPASPAASHDNSQPGNTLATSDARDGEAHRQAQESRILARLSPNLIHSSKTETPS